MRQDTRLCIALHVLLHMSETDAVMTSDTLAPMMKTNPVALRRTMAGLRRAGIVRSAKGHGGGWSLARPLDSVTIRDVYRALAISAPFSIGRREPRPRCLLERSVNAALEAALADAEALLERRFRAVTVAKVLADARPGHARTP